jgi:gliding motility-associated-like protein
MLKKNLFIVSLLLLALRLQAQCDTLLFSAKYDTYKDTFPEYYGDFELSGKDQNGLFRLNGVEKTIELAYAFSFDSLDTRQTHCKFLMKNDDGSSCLYFPKLTADNYDFNTSGTGTSTEVKTTYEYFDKAVKLIGQYFPPEKTDIDTVYYKDIKFYFPTAISPNDDFINDAFRVYASENVLVDKISIFDRWGGLRFEKQNIFSDEIIFSSELELNQGDTYYGFLIFKNTRIEKFYFSVVKK